MPAIKLRRPRELQYNPLRKSPVPETEDGSDPPSFEDLNRKMMELARVENSIDYNESIPEKRLTLKESRDLKRKQRRSFHHGSINSNEVTMSEGEHQLAHSTLPEGVPQILAPSQSSFPKSNQKSRKSSLVSLPSINGNDLPTPPLFVH